MKESPIVADIIAFLRNEGATAYQINSEGYYDAKNGFYRARSSPFSPRGISDIIGTLPEGRAIYVEVKKPSEMKFFDVTASFAEKRCIEAGKRLLSKSTMKKYLHSVEQSNFIEDQREKGAVAFFSSSEKQTKERMIEQGVVFG